MPAPRAVKRLVFVAVAVSVLSTTLLIVAYSRARPGVLLDTVQDLSPAAISLGVLLHFASLATWGTRVWLLAHPFSDRFGLRHGHEAVFASVFTAALTPGRVGGEPARYAVLASHGVPKREAGLLVLLERGLDLVFFVIGGTVALVFLLPLLGLDDLRILLLVGIAVAVVLIALPVMVLLHPRMLHGPIHLAGRFVGEGRVERAKAWLAKEAAELQRSARAVLQSSRWALPLAAMLTATSWLLEFSVIKIMLDAAGADVGWGVVAMGAIVIMIVSGLPLLPGGSGVAELSAYAIFAAASPGLSPAFVIGWRASTYYVDLAVGGAVSVRFAGRELNRVFRRNGTKAAPGEAPPGIATVGADPPRHEGTR